MSELFSNPGNNGYVITEQDYDRLLKKFDDSRREADKRRKGLSKEQFHQIRARFKKDLFFLCTAALGYKDLSVNFHRQFCNWIQQGFLESQFLLALLPRAHFKTSTKTIGHNIQCALPYTKEDEACDIDAHIPLAYPANLGPEIRIAIFHESADEAARFLFMITSHFMNNPILMAFFPECIPSPRTQKINRGELELPRNGIFGEPTFDAKGVTTKSQGNHYNLISPDDIYGKEARDSEAESAQRRTFIDGIFGLLNNPSKDKIFAVGTRYKYDDVYGYMMTKFGNKLNVHRRKVEERDPVTGEMKIAFSERITPDIIEVIKTDKKVYYSEWLNDPSEIGEGFNQEWWKEFEWIDSTRISVFDGRADRPSVVNIRDCYINFLIDPGEITGGFVITATDYWMRTFTLAAIPIDFSSTALVELIFRQAAKWHPSLVSIEADAAQHLLGDWVKMEMGRRKIYFQIHEYYTKKQAKPKRIESLGQLYSAGELFHNETQKDLKREFEEFGKSSNIHILDALAQLMDEGVRRRGFPPGSFGVQMINEQHPYQNEVDPQTGYSVIELSSY